jgi:GNAT superfamily N-acetyltransferase
VARLDGHPAAHAALYLDDQSGTAVLAADGTRPAFRGRGCQTALIAARLAEAARRGYPLAVVEAAPGSTSQRDLERVGFRLAYTKVIWTF